MAMVINTQIKDQEATNICTYCYLYEPLRVVVKETDLTASKLYIDLEIFDTADDSEALFYISRYGDYDINPGKSISIDLMKLAQQHHDADIFHFSNINEIVSSWNSVVSKYKYKFRIYTDITLTPIEVYKLPILGGRIFTDFNPKVAQTQKLTEADFVGVDMNRFGFLPYLKTSLTNPSSTDARPTVEKIISTQGCFPLGGYLIWKSRLGGWMSWGFSIKRDTFKSKYIGNLDVGMFESTQEVNGNPYVPVDYIGIDTSYTISLKELGLTSKESRAVAGINHSPAVYILKNDTEKLELMRVSSASIPLNNLDEGGDFLVSLKSISQSNYKTK